MVQVDLHAVLVNWHNNKEQIINELSQFGLSDIQWVFDHKPVALVALPNDPPLDSIERIATGNFVICEM